MNAIFFDTETNGLPHVRKAPIELVENWPRIISVAWSRCVISADSTVVLKSEYFIVKPEGFEWSADAEKIHGISHERANQEGVSIKTILPLLMRDMAEVSIVVAHNMNFDKPILLAEFVRQGLPINWWPRIQYCTMDSTKGLCKLPSKYPRASDPYKFPKLSELHTYLFGNLEGFAFHSAKEDVRCLVKCFEELVFRRVAPLDAWTALMLSA